MYAQKAIPLSLEQDKQVHKLELLEGDPIAISLKCSYQLDFAKNANLSVKISVALG